MDQTGGIKKMANIETTKSYWESMALDLRREIEVIRKTALEAEWSEKEFEILDRNGKPDSLVDTVIRHAVICVANRFRSQDFLSQKRLFYLRHFFFEAARQAESYLEGAEDDSEYDGVVPWGHDQYRLLERCYELFLERYS